MDDELLPSDEGEAGGSGEAGGGVDGVSCAAMSACTRGSMTFCTCEKGKTVSGDEQRPGPSDLGSSEIDVAEALS